MRLKTMNVCQENSKIEVNILDMPASFAIVVSEGVAKFTELPPHGETKIVTHQGKVKRIKYDEGEDF